MKARKLFLMLVAILTVFSFSLCGDPAGETTTIGDFSMPESIGLYVPDNIYDSSAVNKSFDSISRAPGDTNVTGWAYGQLKGFTTAGVFATEMVDFILSNVAVHSTFFASNKGVLATNINSEGWWLFYDDQSSGSGFYLYIGTNEGVTNLYIDWVASSSGFTGTAVYYVSVEDPQAEVADAMINFDTGAELLDIYFNPNSGYAWWEEMRITIEQYASNAVTVIGRGILTNAMTNSITNNNWEGSLREWDLLGYSSEDSTGGVKAWANAYLTEVPNIDYIGISNFVLTNTLAIFSNILETNSNFTDYEAVQEYVIASNLNIGDFTNAINITANYAYEEYFDNAGSIRWKMGVFSTTASNVDPYTNETFTNNTKPTTVEGILDGLNKITDVSYPSITLP